MGARKYPIARRIGDLLSLFECPVARSSAFWCLFASLRTFEASIEMIRVSQPPFLSGVDFNRSQRLLLLPLEDCFTSRVAARCANLIPTVTVRIFSGIMMLSLLVLGCAPDPHMRKEKRTSANNLTHVLIFVYAHELKMPECLPAAASSSALSVS